jgi:hypothetical protein
VDFPSPFSLFSGARKRGNKLFVDAPGVGVLGLGPWVLGLGSWVLGLGSPASGLGPWALTLGPWSEIRHVESVCTGTVVTMDSSL